MTPVSWNTDQEILPSGVRTTRIGQRWRNFLGPNGWERIDLGFRGRCISRAPYLLDCPRMANGPIRYEATTRWNVHTRSFMHDQPKGITKRYFTAAPVPGVLTADGMLYAGAFPQLNADLLIRPGRGRVDHLIVFRAAPATFEVPFEIEADELSGQRGVGFMPARVWDSAGLRQPIAIRARRERGRMVWRKIIPPGFFRGAVFPVYADTTTVHYPDANPESTSVDARVGRTGDGTENWATLRGGAGTLSLDASTSLGDVCQATATTNIWQSIERTIMLFDTSSLADAITIVSATLNVKTKLKSTEITVSHVVVSSNPASNTATVASDYANLGTTAFASTVANSALTNGVYRAFTLNASGLAAITPTGVSKFGLILEEDRANTAPSWVSGGAGGSTFDSADTAAQTSDPHLDVTDNVSTAIGPILQGHVITPGRTFGGSALTC